MTDIGALADRQVPAPMTDRQVVATPSLGMSEIWWLAAVRRYGGDAEHLQSVESSISKAGMVN